MRMVRAGWSGGRAWARRLAMLGVALVAMTGCVQNSDPEVAAEPVAPTVLRVDNRAFLDMTIYVYRSSQRIRLGQATGNSVSKFVIPANMLFGPTALRFQADPIGGSRTPVSEEITVTAGDEVVLTIPPN